MQRSRSFVVFFFHVTGTTWARDINHVSITNHEKGPDSNGQFVHYLEKRVEQVVAIINIIAAALLLIGAIISLYYVQKPAARVGIITLFTVLFAVSIALFTNAKRAEVFAATAAYAAVLVVFVSGDLAQKSG